MQYFGVYAAPPPLPLLNGEPRLGRSSRSRYKIVRPSKVTAQLVGPDGVAARRSRPASRTSPARTRSRSPTLRRRGDVALERRRRPTTSAATSTIDRTVPVRHDAAGLARAAARARTARRSASRSRAPRKVRLQIETKTGVVVRDAAAPVALAAGRAVGRLGRPPAARARRRTPGAYVAHVFATSAVGTSDLAASVRVQTRMSRARARDLVARALRRSRRLRPDGRSTRSSPPRASS